jgi:hypothetical protein
LFRAKLLRYDFVDYLRLIVVVAYCVKFDVVGLIGLALVVMSYNRRISTLLGMVYLRLRPWADLLWFGCVGGA